MAEAFKTRSDCSKLLPAGPRPDHSSSAKGHDHVSATRLQAAAHLSMQRGQPAKDHSSSAMLQRPFRDGTIGSRLAALSHD